MAQQTITKSEYVSTPVEPNLMRTTMGRFATGVAVVTTELNGEVHGMTVNSLASVSLDPPLLLLCLVRDARTTDAVLERRAFVVNVLHHHQQEIANHFARPGGDRTIGGLGWSPSGVPYIPKCLARIDCTLEGSHPGGDHLIIVGRVRECEGDDGAPLVFSGGFYQKLADGDRVPWYSDSAWFCGATW